MPFVSWLLVTGGVTLIVTDSILFLPLRTRFLALAGGYWGKLFTCSMCFGFWVGVLLSLLGMPLAGLPPSWPWWLAAWASGAASSTAAYSAHVVRAALERWAFPEGK